MAERLWHYLINSILVATLGSYRAMRVIGNFTVNALNVTGNTFLLALRARLLPFVTDYNSKYTIWLNSLGTEESSVNSVYVFFQLLRSTYIRDWDIAIQSVYNIKTAMYKLLMPDRRTPYQTGSEEDKLGFLQALSLGLVGVAGLAAVKTDVDAKIVIIQGFMNARTTNKAGSRTASDNVEEARVALAEEMYGILGQLMDHNRATPEATGNYFDVSAIRNLEQTLWRRAIKIAKTIALFTRTLVPTDQLRLVNLGLTTLRFAFVATKGGVIGIIFVDVLPLQGVTVNRSALGAISSRFFAVENLSTTAPGKFMVVLI